MKPGPVTVFGGSGFLGRRIVGRLLAEGRAVRLAALRPERARDLFPGGAGRLEPVAADVADPTSTAAALAGAAGAVNAVSLYVERGGRTFRSIHVEAAARVARLAREAGVARLVHVSGIGADPASPSAYVRSRGEGENAVSTAFPGAVLVRPAVMVAHDDGFLTVLVDLVRRLPAVPMFGDGMTLLQPALADDVAEAVAAALGLAEPSTPYELGGPERLTYRALLERIAHRLGRPARLVPVPFAVWLPAASLAGLLPRPPLTRSQVELMQADNVASPAAAGFDRLGVAPRPLGVSLDRLLGPSGDGRR